MTINSFQKWEQTTLSLFLFFFKLRFFDTETFESKIVPVERVQSYEWSPSANIISFCVPEKGTIPAKACLMEYPSKREIKTKNFFKVKEDIIMNWSPKGDIVTFKVNTESKKGQKTKPKTNFEFFFVKKRNIPITTLTIDDTVTQNFWSPKGNVFTIVIPRESQKNDFQFYKIEQTDIKFFNEVKERLFTHLYWSPRGRYGVFHSPKSMAGALEFYDFDNLEFLGQGEHFMVTDLQWDPTGRYLASSVSYHEHQSENGFIIWSFLGKMIHNMKVEKFWQFQWRPRPKSLLSEEEDNAIQKSLVQKKNEIVKESKELEKQQKKEISDKRNKLMQEWNDLREKMLKVYQEHQKKLGVKMDDDSDYVEVEREIIEVLEQKVEEV
jgi:translation initiation factor 3 subunit B